MVQPHRPRPNRITHERLEQRSARREELAAELPQEFPPSRIATVVIGCGEPLFRGREHALEVHEKSVLHQMGVDAAWTAAEELDLEPGHRMAGCRLDLTL